MVAAEAGARESAEELRQQGNAAYRDKQYLRAAAIYSQAIKIDANDAVLYRCIFLFSGGSSDQSGSDAITRMFHV